MDFIFQSGFLGTRAPLFMDIVSVIVAFLPFLIFGAIFLAKQKNYQAHESVQKLLFVVTVIVVAFFEFGVRVVGGYKHLIEGSSVGHNYFIYVLIFHIIISVVTLVLWIMTLHYAKRYKKQGTLPGLYSKAHQKAGQRTFIGIILTMLTGGWVYALLFVY
ncbi:MAG: DUF420 domain-containing protein [Sulfurovum sp.]|nr:DUF420 domain-containing protein [Sulfurovum sp.]